MRGQAFVFTMGLCALAGGCNLLTGASDFTLLAAEADLPPDAGDGPPLPGPGPEDARAPEPIDDAGDVVVAEASVDAVADAPGTPLRVFVSSQVRSGNLGGLAGADAWCKQLATAASLGGSGKWVAWLSVNGTDAIDRVTARGPWQLVTGQLVASTKASLTSGSLLAPIRRTESGTLVAPSDDRVWTGTRANGTSQDLACNGWSSGGSGFGSVGEAEFANADWTAQSIEACANANRVYCFEQ